MITARAVVRSAQGRGGRGLSIEDVQVAVREAMRGEARLPAGAIDAYLAEQVGRVTPKHARHAALVLRRVLSACPALDRRDVVAHRQRLIDKGLSRRTAEYDLVAARAFTRWCVAENLLGRDPLAGLKKLPANETHLRKRRRALAEIEIARLLAAADKLDAEWRKERGWRPQAPLWRALVETGMRWGEIRSLRGRDVRKGVAVLGAGATKARRGRTLPLSPTLLALIGKPEPEDFVFLRPDGKPWTEHSTHWALGLLRLTLERARIPRKDVDGRDVDIHALRRTCATRLARKGAPIAAVSKVLGHADIRTTMRYYVDFTENDAREALRVAW